MKINAITLAAAAAAAFAAAVAWRRAHPQSGVPAGPDNVYLGNMAQQHDTVQAATPNNIDYLANWTDLSNAWGNDPKLWL